MMTGIRKKIAASASEEEQVALMKNFQELKKQSIQINKNGLGRIITR
jgi:hypothetical protein